MQDSVPCRFGLCGEDGGWFLPPPGLGQAAGSRRLLERSSHRPGNRSRGRVIAAATFGERSPTAFSPRWALVCLPRPPGTPVFGPRAMSCFSTLSPGLGLSSQGCLLFWTRVDWPLAERASHCPGRSRGRAASVPAHTPACALSSERRLPFSEEQALNWFGIPGPPEGASWWVPTFW
ncbi:uncharacterized protein LOC115897637 [Rhinopithecus roxellana]|uniref:uncharacterized protein LOC115897637 n=1 Tax=Rhinopithecus roxellana TaxID=61622 RepID=UPI0012372C6D|nr:uncharacterized protein LOC115897637 [Rhinopithecus roxellana]